LEAISQILKMFENFIKRAIIPSISFYFIFVVEYLYFIDTVDKDKVVQKFALSIKVDDFTVLFLVVMLIGLSFLLSMLHQVFYDNLIKGDYDCKIPVFKKYCNIELNILKEKTIKKVKEKIFKGDLEIDEKMYTDYFLYQVVGRKLAAITPKTNTTRYVDDSKSIGIFFISLMLVNIILFFGSWLLLIVLISIFYAIGFQLIQSKYRSRAIRIYVNYLLGETD